MEEQSYAKHARFVPLFDGVLFGLIVVAFLGGLVDVTGTSAMEMAVSPLRCS